ncbi:MAG: right-handed parallel beta-helix repeat-containing protein [Clostridia bacterium]|nr:right-handed parallel beta-helix repeat-containing protein [Clostridia bacterium]
MQLILISGAIKSSSRNVIIKNCEISNTAQTAIYILGGRYNVVGNCNIHDVNNAIIVNAGDAKSLYTGGNIIRNNRISKFARLDKTYTYAVSLYGMGHTVEHNKIYDSEHAAIYFQGVENEIKNNDISNVCKETEDAGAIYAGRKWTSRDNKITGNYIHDISSNIETPSPVGAIFLDDHFADVQIDGNIFANINGTAIRGNAGREHNIANNIFVNCVQSAWITSYPTPSVEKYATQIADAQNFIYKNTEEVSRGKYQEKYFDELYKYDEDGTTVIVNTDELIYGKGLIYKNNLTVNGKDNPEYKFGDLCEVTIEGNKYANNASTYFVNPASKDYTIKLSAIQSAIPGFTAIDFSAMKID